MGKRVLLVLVLCLFLIILSSVISAETYFIRNSGTASKSAAAQSNGGGCSSDSRAMSVSTHNSASFSPGDTIYICNAITQIIQLIPPSSGTSSGHITYRGDYPGYSGSLQQHMQWPETRALMFIKNKQYIKIHNLVFDSDVTTDRTDSWAALWIEDSASSTGHIEIKGCTFKETLSGIYICGNSRYVDVFSSNFHDMASNGVGVFKCWDDYTGLPNHITVGGSRENGNTFVNIGREENPTSGSVPGQVIGTQADDLIFSYNHVYADKPGWGTGVYLNGVDRVLVEYNYIHDIDAVHRRPAINFKSDDDWKNNDIVIRFNKVGPTHLGNPRTTYVDPDYGIRIGRCVEDALIYGNYVFDVEAAGINAQWGWVDDGSNYDNCYLKNIFIYSNIIDTTIKNSGISIDGIGAGTDKVEDLYIFNNVIYDTVTNYDSGASQRYGIQAISSDSKYDGMTIKNNIIDTSRDNDAKHVGIRVRVQSDLSIDYNHHYFPGSTPSVYFDGSSCVPCAWNSASRPSGYGTHDTGSDPGFIGRNSGDFRLADNSPCKETGQALSIQMPSFTIQGQTYTFSASEALDPVRTDWSPTIPFVYTLDQNNYGAWERGAYVYTGTSIPICSQGQITQTCLCGGVEYSSDFCCSNNWQSSECPLPPPPISQAGWSLLYVDSEELIYEDDAATNAFDNNANTFWHSEWYQNTDSHPHEIQIDLGANYILSSLSYLPRQDNENGRIASYEFYVSSDGNNWGSSVASGSFVNSASAQEITFSDVNARYIRLVALSEVNGEPWTSVAEINLFGELSSSTSQCSSGADTTAPYDIVSISELINYISSWKSGSVSINELINAIGEWKNGC